MSRLVSAITGSPTDFNWMDAAVQKQRWNKAINQASKGLRLHNRVTKQLWTGEAFIDHCQGNLYSFSTGSQKPRPHRENEKEKEKEEERTRERGRPSRWWH